MLLFKNELTRISADLKLSTISPMRPCWRKSQQRRALNLMLLYTSNAGCQTIEAIRIGCKPRDDIWQSRCCCCCQWWCGVFSAFKAEATQQPRSHFFFFLHHRCTRSCPLNGLSLSERPVKREPLLASIIPRHKKYVGESCAVEVVATIRNCQFSSFCRG